MLLAMDRHEDLYPNNIILLQLLHIRLNFPASEAQNIHEGLGANLFAVLVVSAQFLTWASWCQLDWRSRVPIASKQA